MNSQAPVNNIVVTDEILPYHIATENIHLIMNLIETDYALMEVSYVKITKEDVELCINYGHKLIDITIDKNIWVEFDEAISYRTMKMVMSMLNDIYDLIKNLMTYKGDE